MKGYWSLWVHSLQTPSSDPRFYSSLAAPYGEAGAFGGFLKGGILKGFYKGFLKGSMRDLEGFRVY